MGWQDKGLFDTVVLCWEPELALSPRVVQRPELVLLEQEGTKENFWPVFMWQETAIRTE